MALGAGSVTPLQMAEGYSVFANTEASGYIRILSAGLRMTVASCKMEPEVAGENTERTLDARNAFVMTNMMHDVVRFGTAAKARSLGRNDPGRQTGTTNDANDAWFAGFQPKLVAVVWMGLISPNHLAATKQSGAAALPIWINYMAKALKGQPEAEYPVPDGVIAQTLQTERATNRIFLQ